MTSLRDPAASEWPTVRLDEVATRGSGHTPSKRRPEYWAGPSRIKWVSLADTGRLDKGPIADTEHSITELGLAHSAAVLRPAGTVILLRGSSVGKSAVMGSEMAVSQDYVTWTCGPMLDPWFLYYLLQSRKAEFARVGFGNTIKTIGLDYFKHLVIPLPELLEQRRICQALKDADHLIASLQDRIAKKYAIRQGMMEQLLTGRRRLARFEAPWTNTAIGELAQIVSGGTPKSSVRAYWDGGIAWCTPSDITREHGRFLRGTERTISREGLERSAARLLPAGSLLLCTRATIGDVKLAATEIATNQGFKSLIPRVGVSAPYLYYKVLTLKDDLAAKGTGSTFLEVSKRDVASLTFRAPPYDEQVAIASILSDVDDELTLSQDRLEKARAVKTGMMQQLLAGRRRLPVEAAS